MVLVLFPVPAPLDASLLFVQLLLLLYFVILERILCSHHRKRKTREERKLLLLRYRILFHTVFFFTLRIFAQNTRVLVIYILLSVLLCILLWYPSLSMSAVVWSVLSLMFLPPSVFLSLLLGISSFFSPGV